MLLQGNGRVWISKAVPVSGIRVENGAWWLAAILVLFAVSSHSQSQRMLCNEGFGSFYHEYETGVAVKVGASKRTGTFASHTCDATIRWRKSELAVVRGALQADIDVMGADLGLGVPVVAFQTRDSARDTGMIYQVYSIEGTPRLLRTITGGSYYSTQDVRLEDRNEIWTDDAVAIDGFEKLPFASYDFAPTVVLRFEKLRLIDAGSEYQPYYDRRIAEAKTSLDQESLSEFRQSDGMLRLNSPFALKNLAQLRAAKVKVLEIVWSYLYSGREDEAWNALSEMWPASDLGRIRTALEDLHSHGILRQTDGSAKQEHRSPWKRRAVVFDMVTMTKRMIDRSNNVVSAGGDTPTVTGGRMGEPTQLTVDVAPIPIFLGLTVSKGSSQTVPDTKVYLNLVIDAAGKVRSAKLENAAENDSAGATEVAASASWNFIPAYKSGHAVACRIRMGVWPQQ